MNQTLIPDFTTVIPAVEDSGLFVSVCTIQQPSGTLDASGQPDGLYTNVTGLVSIPCMSAPVSMARIAATEVKALEEILSLQVRHVLLDGYYPTIAAGVGNGWRAVIDGTTYDLMGAESDSQSQMTRINVRIAEI